MIITILWWLIRIAVVSGVVAFLSTQKGYTGIEWMGWRVDIPTSILIGVILILIASILWISNLWRLFKEMPFKILKSINDRRQRNGYQALAYGLIASSAGDVEGAQKFASKAKRLLENRDLTEMLSAHATHLAGDRNAAKKYFHRLSQRETTAFHGHLGLMRLAIESANKIDALKHARESSILQPRNPQLTKMLVKMEAQSKNYLEAIDTLQRARRIGAIEEKEALPLAAALNTALGQSAIEKNNLNDAQKYFSYALREKADFIPAAVPLSKIYLSQGSSRKANNLLSKIWKLNPHPEIANTFKIIWEEERPSGTIAKLIEVTEENADSQARLLIADAALKVGLTGEADGQLNKVKPDDYNSFYFHLKSKVAEINDDQAALNLAMKNAYNAKRKHSWNCTSCGIASEIWEISCKQCDSIGTLIWKSPPYINNELDISN